MKITVKGKSNERVKVTSDKRKDEVEQVLLEIRKMCRNLNKLLKKEFEIELTISSEDIAYREDWISYGRRAKWQDQEEQIQQESFK